MTSQPLDGTNPALLKLRQDPSLLTQVPTELLPPELQAFQQEQKLRDIAADFEVKFTQIKHARVPFERQWYINLAFVSGKQYVAPVEIPGQGFRLQSPRVPAHRVRLVINKVRTAIRTECSKLTMNKPIPVVMPKTTEDEDYSAAEIAELILKAEFSTAAFGMIYRSWIWWGVVCGNSFLKSYWDPNFIDDEAQPEATPAVGLDGQPLVTPDGQPIIQQMVVKGKIRELRVTPWEIYVPNLLAEDIEEQPFVIHAMTRTPLWVENTFGFKPQCDARSSGSIMDSAFLITKGSADNATMDSCLVKEVWIKPGGHKDFPEGGMLTIINGRAVQSTFKWPWPFKEYPFYKFDAMRTGGFYCDSILVDLIPLQKEYNRTRSQMVEIKNVMGKPRFLYQQGSLDPRRVNSEAGQMIPYAAGFMPPTPLPAAEVPATMPMELQTLTSDFDDISGQHEITRGNTPPQVTSGTAISFLQEQDDSKLSDSIASIEASMEKLGKHYLKMVNKFWDQPRMLKITGKDMAYETMLFQGSDLKGNTDVQIQSGSALPTSKAALTAQITEFMQNGWLDPATGMEILQMGAFSKALDELLIDKKQAMRENLKMSKLNPQDVAPQQMINPETGQPAVGSNGDPIYTPTPPAVPVNSWDAHDLHVHFHNQYRKTQEFELLPPEIKQEFEKHVQMHQIAMMVPQANAMGMMVQPGQQDSNMMQDPAASDPAAGDQVTPPQQ